MTLLCCQCLSLLSGTHEGLKESLNVFFFFYKQETGNTEGFWYPGGPQSVSLLFFLTNPRFELGEMLFLKQKMVGSSVCKARNEPQQQGNLITQTQQNPMHF